MSSRDEEVDYEESSAPMREAEPGPRLVVRKKGEQDDTQRVGRGFTTTFDATERYGGTMGEYDSVLPDARRGNVQKSVEGYVLIVTGVHEEAQEDDVVELFGEFGDVKQLHLNLDRQTGYCKGYALLEYETYESAAEAIQQLNGQTLLGNTISVAWAFKKTAKQ